MEKKMFKQKPFIMIFSTIFFINLFFNTLSYADEQKEAGFSGFLLIGGSYTGGNPSLDDASTGESMNSDILKENQRITSLYQDSKDVSEYSPVVTGNLNYIFASTGTRLSLGSGEGSGLFSISQPLDHIGTFSLGFNYEKFDVWQDPFITGTDRVETDLETTGGIFSWENILDSTFYLNYALDDIKIDNDVAGNRDEDLKRDGRLHTAKAGAQLIATERQSLSSGIVFEYADMTGKSFNYNGYGLELAYVLNGRNWNFETGIFATRREYDRVHPEFNKTREDDICNLGASYRVLNPFGLNNYFIMFFGSYSYANSNIKFYDKSIFTTGAGIGYSF